ncbi:MAG: GDP-mannose 4,6-dehydratase [Phycisphaerales bacterium]|nr:GDP-mannose 4,6-dehydratase [Phycisphaerales bacterium]MCI0629078.1 GDP-mannose 4,6-dehydratase [Phycisphaerales bacterium]MCI0675624.1 GDP-mannose 4,6-dehydratase [Phycisphaerales bacterium]
MKSPSTGSQHQRGGRRSAAVLITGAGGEVGHGLIGALHASGGRQIVAIDIRELDAKQRAMCQDSFVGDICDRSLLERLLAMYEITEIYHLAALLSTRGEFTPETAHEVNVNGTVSLLRLAAEQARSHGQRVKFIFPSSIAVYGMPSVEIKGEAGAVGEDEFCRPITMYGCNKLYCEHLGRYYSHHYRLLAQDRVPDVLDFRSIRFPGLISADTLPSGGTSDYGPEMLHAAAAGKEYACFVRPDTRIPFMTMPDAIDALLKLAEVERKRLGQCVYNVTSFNPSAGEFATLAKKCFPRAKIRFEPDEQRQQIVDSWPENVDDGAARRDWGFAPRHDLQRAFEEYLVPRISARYR